MADPARFLAALLCLVFNHDAAFLITKQLGMDSLNEFRFLTNKKDEDLCKVVHKPGGTIANLNATEAGQPAEITNPGSPVSLKATNNLKIMCYFLRFCYCMHCMTLPAKLTVERVRHLCEYKEWEESHKDPDVPKLTFKDWPCTIATIQEYLHTCLGTTKISITYVIPENEAIPNQDLPEGHKTILNE